ncbi:MAG: hypothetical protein KDE58_02180, partial [Caldilineaceae bacterium]|nr:hypothetical protein [Caldilineaceae bacterium]
DAGISASTATSMTLRAGVIVDDAVDDGQSLWLHMNDSPGATTFVDASLNGHDLSCTTCPSASGSTLTFSDSNQALALNVRTNATDIDLNSFSVGAWVRQVSDEGHFYLFRATAYRFDGTNEHVSFSWTDTDAASDTVEFLGQLEGNVGGGFGSVPRSVIERFRNVSPGTWQHMMLTYDSAARQMSLYLNGTRIGSSSDAIQIPVDNIEDIVIGSYNTGVFEVDEFELYPHVLDAQTIRSRYGGASLQLDLTDTGNGVSCDGDRCPDFSKDGANFYNQTQHLTLDKSGLSFSDNQFSIAIDVNPQQRDSTFTTEAGDYFGIDTSQDWQGIYGYQDPDNDKLIFPSLFVGSNGALRIDMGDGANTCRSQTADGLVDFFIEQQVAVSYDGSAFTFYINGEKQDSNVLTACGGMQVPNINQIYVGSPNDFSYLHWQKVDIDKNVGLVNRVCLQFDENSATDPIWHNDGPPKDFKTYTMNVGRRIDSGNHWFRLHNDSSSTTCDYRLGLDREWSYQENLSNTSELGSFVDRFEDVNGLRGDLYWSHTNQSFRGTLRNLSIFDYALSPTGAERVYNAKSFALQMAFDEAPGATVLVDSSGNYFEAGCAGASCPDSGLPGRWNEALRFDGGVADDDGNDGVADYLAMDATDAALGFDEDSFTIMAWVKPDAVNGVRRILAAERTNSANGVGFGVANGNLFFTTLGVKHYQSTQSDIPVGEWSHVAVSFDDDNAAHFYVNGQFVETVTGSAPVSVNNDDGYRIGATTGAGNTTTSEAWDGLIDDLRILHYAVDAGTVQRMMNEAPLLNLHLDEDLNTTSFVDDSLGGYDATCAGDACPGAGDKGQIRESATFDGVDDMLEVPGTEDLPLETFTVALWVKPTQQRSDYQPLIYKAADDGSTGRTFGLFIFPDSMRVHHSLRNANCSSWVSDTSSGSLLQNQWNHVVMTYDGSENRVYINGALDNTMAYVGTPCDQGNIVRLGSVAPSTPKYLPFAGNLDEVTVEEGALSADEVRDLYDYQSAWYDEKQQHTILVDADAPTVSVPLENAFIDPGTVLYIAAVDPTVNGVASGLASVQYSIDGGAFMDAAVDNSSYFIPASATAGLGDGSHTVEVRATDKVGLSSTASQVSAAAAQTVQVDTTAPTPGTGVNVVDEPLLVKTGSIRYAGTATDDQGVVQSGIDKSSL